MLWHGNQWFLGFEYALSSIDSWFKCLLLQEVALFWETVETGDGAELEKGGDWGEDVVKVGVSLAASLLSQDMNSVLYYTVLSCPAQAHGTKKQWNKTWCHELEPVFPPLSYSEHSNENQYTSGCCLVTPTHLYLWLRKILAFVLPITKNWLSICVEVRWQLLEVNSLLFTTIWSQGSKSSHQVWWQVPLLAELHDGSGSMVVCMRTQVGVLNCSPPSQAEAPSQAGQWLWTVPSYCCTSDSKCYL